MGRISFFFPFLSHRWFWPSARRSTVPPLTPSQRLKAAPGKPKRPPAFLSIAFPCSPNICSGRPDSVYAEQQARFDPLPVNYEFLLPVEQLAIERMVAEASETPSHHLDR